MKAMSFYTANGWAGSNYDSKLSTKEIAAKVRSYAKKNFPEFKFSVRSEWSMYTDSMYIELKSGPCVPFVEGSRSPEIVSNTDISKKKRKKSLQDIIDQTRRINGYAGRNWYWSLKREKLINKIYSDYVTNIQKLGAFSDTKKKFTREQYAGITSTELPVLPEEIYIPELAEEPQGNDTPLIIDDYAKYDSFDYPTIPEELNGFRLGEVVYDQCGEIGVILAFNEKNGTARVNSNGCCNVGNLKKCPKEIAEREVKYMDIIRPGKDLTDCTAEAHPLDNIRFTETANFNGVHYYDIEGARIITSAKVREDIQPGDVFNVYTDGERKFCVTYDGVSVESSLKNDLPGIIEFNDKIELDTLSISSYYTPMAEGMKFYEKKVKGKRYITENKPKRGWYVIDTLDNCPVGFFQTKEEAEKEAETLNGFTDGNGRLKTVI